MRMISSASTWRSPNSLRLSLLYRPRWASFAAAADVPSAPRIPVAITPAPNVKPVRIEPPISVQEREQIVSLKTQLARGQDMQSKMSELETALREANESIQQYREQVASLEKKAGMIPQLEAALASERAAAEKLVEQREVAGRPGRLGAGAGRRPLARTDRGRAEVGGGRRGR